MLSTSRCWSILLGGLVFAGAAANGRAQDASEEMRKKYMIAVPDLMKLTNPAGIFRGSPGSNSGTPLAFGPAWGDAFVGGGFQGSTRGIKQANGSFTDNGHNDGSISAGFGAGDPNAYVGLEVVATSLSTFRSGFFNRTALGFKVHKMLDNSSAIAIGFENAFILGGGKTDGATSTYLAVSKVFQLPANETGLFKAVTISGGVGNGRFRFLDDVNKKKQTVNVFGSGSILITDFLSVMADWTGQDLNLGMSFVPFKQFPIAITPSLADVTQTASKSARFMLGAGIGMHF